MKAGRVLAMALIVALTVALALAAQSVYKAGVAIEEAQRRLANLKSDVASAQQDESLHWGQHIQHLSSVEPAGDAAVYGVYRARIVKVDGNAITFDWLGYSPDPHGGSKRTNASRHFQSLRPQPLSFIKLLDKQGQLVNVSFPDTLESLSSQDATGKALLESDWWVGVAGPNWVELVQAD